MATGTPHANLGVLTQVPMIQPAYALNAAGRPAPLSGLHLYPARAFVPVCCGAAYLLVHRSRRWGTLTFASGSGQLSLV